MKKKNLIGGIKRNKVNKKITRIRKCKKKVVVYLNKEKLDLSFDAFSSFYLYEGKELSDKEIKEIKNQNETTSLTNYALSLLKKSRYSEWKIREKLYLKEASKSQVDLVINNLKKAGLIDDYQFALDLYEYLSSKNYGKNKIIQTMSDKGVFIDSINKISFPYEDEIKKAKCVLPSLINKYSKYNYEQQKNHIYNALISKGFANDVARMMINDIPKKNNNDELLKLKVDYQKVKNRLSSKYKGKELNDKIISSLMMKGYKYQDIIKVR